MVRKRADFLSASKVSVRVVLGFNLVRAPDVIRPMFENTRSAATLEAGTARNCRANSATSGKEAQFLVELQKKHRSHVNIASASK